VPNIIIVGATSGIGLAVAKIFVSKGYKVGVTGRRCELLQQFQSTSPQQIFTSCFDVTKTETVPDHLQSLMQQMGGLDILLISAGYGDENPSLDYAIEAGMLEVNVKGFTAVADWSFQYFQQQKSGQLAAITSLAGVRGNRAAPAYFSTKGYQIRYLESLSHRSRKEKLNINITDIRPGFVQTKPADHPLFWSAPVEKAARQIAHAIIQKRKVVYITRRWGIVAFLLKIFPRWIYEKI
jgi:short-subunit dehydrogenase